MHIWVLNAKGFAITEYINIYLVSALSMSIEGKWLS